MFRRDVQHADLRGHDDQVVVGDVVAGRAQAVAVEHGADARAVGEDHRRRAVPGLHQAGVIFVEGPLVIAHGLVVLPGLGDHHHHGVRQRAPAVAQKLQRVVEHGGVAATGSMIGSSLARSSPKSADSKSVCAGRIQLTLPRRVLISPLWRGSGKVGQLPGRKGVGAEARVDQGQGGDHQGSDQVGKIGAPGRREHALIDQRAAREAGDVKSSPSLGPESEWAFDPFADHVELALESC